MIRFSDAVRTFIVPRLAAAVLALVAATGLPGATPDGRGYWLAGADGGVFPFGDAQGFGSAATPAAVPPGVVLGGD